MNEKTKDLSIATVVHDASDDCISAIPLLVESLRNVTRETEVAALNILANLREILRKNAAQESGISLGDLLVSLQFQDITRQETEKVIESLISLKERLEAMKNQIGGSEAAVKPKKMIEAPATGPADDSGESVVLF